MDESSTAAQRSFRDLGAGAETLALELFPSICEGHIGLTVELFNQRWICSLNCLMFFSTGRFL